MPKKRWVLLNPGPVNVTPRVRHALLGPDICHREPEFSELLRKTKEALLGLFKISKTHQVAVFTGSGTTALEAMLSSLAQDRKKILVLSNGVYGERMHEILTRQDFPVAFLPAGMGEFPEFDNIEKILKSDASIHGIAVVHHETSSGMLNPLAKVASLAKKYKKTLLVDAISSLGAETIDLKNIGFLAGVSGKCVHGFPGVSWVILSHDEAKKLKNKKSKSLYLDLDNTLTLEEKNDTPFTPAVQIFYALEEALDELIEEGLKNRIKNYAKKAALVQEGLEALGVRCVIEDKNLRSNVLSAFWLPSSLNYEKLHDGLKKNGFVIYAGQSKLKDKIFRISNLGDMSLSDLSRFLKIFAKFLKAGRS